MTRLQRVITSARGKKLSVKRANIEAWKGTRTVSFYTDNKERARLRNATKRPRGVSSITRKSSVDFSSRRRKIGAFLFSKYIFSKYRIEFSSTVERTFSITSHGQLRGRASMREDRYTCPGYASNRVTTKRITARLFMNI